MPFLKSISGPHPPPCPAATARHSLEHGYRTLIVDDGCKGITEEDIDSTKDHIVSNTGVVIQSHQVGHGGMARVVHR